MPRGPSSESPTGRYVVGPRPAEIVSPGMPALLPGSVLRMKRPNVAGLLASGPWATATCGDVGLTSASMPWILNVSAKWATSAGRELVHVRLAEHDGAGPA